MSASERSSVMRTERDYWLCWLISIGKFGENSFRGIFGENPNSAGKCKQ